MNFGSVWRFLHVDSFLAPITEPRGIREHQVSGTLGIGSSANQAVQFRKAVHYPLAIPLHGCLDALPHTRSFGWTLHVPKLIVVGRTHEKPSTHHSTDRSSSPLQRIISPGLVCRPASPRHKSASPRTLQRDGARQIDTTERQPVGPAAVGVGGAAEADAGATANWKLHLRRVSGTSETKVQVSRGRRSAFEGQNLCSPTQNGP